ncbi:MAG: hypothetical protein K6C08_09675 [Oscillospiraceae bacterium]|nr:hypothetical protein [Oscillospiraceae bacterium]
MKKLVLHFFPLFLLPVLLCACSKANYEESRTVSLPAVPSPHTEYRSSFIPLTGSFEGSLEPILSTDKGFFAFGEEPVGGQDSTDPNESLYSDFLYSVDSSGYAEKLPSFQPFLPPDTEEADPSSCTFISLSQPAVTPDGNFVALLEQYRVWYDAPDKGRGSDELYQYYQYELQYDIVRLNTDGALISRSPVQLDIDDSRLHADHTVCDSDGNLLIFRGSLLFAVAADGSIAYRLPCEGSPVRALSLPDGRIAVLVDHDGDLSLLPLDPGTHAPGKPVHLPPTAQVPIPGTGNYDFYYSDGIALYGGKLVEGGPVRLFRWMDYDICGDCLDSTSLHISDDGMIWGILRIPEADTEKAELFTLTRATAGSLPDREVLTFAQLQDSDRQFNRRIAAFNRSQDRVRIEIRDYTVYNSEKDPSAGAAVFLRELLAGGGTDLMPLASLPYRQLAAKGLLENLYPYLDADPELSRNDILPNVLSALEVNGFLYQTASGFSVRTLTGPADLVGTAPGWTYDEYDTAVRKLSADGTAPLFLTTCGQALQALLALNMDRFLEADSGEVRLDAGEFRKLLDFASLFPVAIGQEDSGNSAPADSSPQKTQQFLSEFCLCSMDALLWNELSYGGKVTCVGWPTDSGVGSVMLMDDGCAIGSSCRNKDAAWTFLRSLLTEEGQAQVYTIPTNRKVFDRKLTEATAGTFLKDSSGADILDQDGNRIPESLGEWFDESGTEHSIYALSPEQASDFLAVIESCTHAADDGSLLYTAVQAEIPAYFEGRISLEEVCSRIQSSASLSSADSP